MAAVSGKYAWVTPRSMRIFTLDDNGRPYSTDSATAYEGSQAIAVKNLNLAIPDMRVYEHVGDDVLLQRDVLPSDSGVGADFTLGMSDYSLIAAMTGVTQRTSTGTEGKGMRYGTDGERDIPQVGVHIYGQVVDVNAGATQGARRWRSLFFPRCYLKPKPSGFVDGVGEVAVQVVPVVVTQELWGITLTEAADGCTTFQVSDWMTQYRPKVLTWVSQSGTPAQMLFPANYQAQAIAKVHEFTIDGVDAHAAATIAVDGVTPGTVADGGIMVSFYEFNAVHL